MPSTLKIHSLRGDDEFQWDPAIDDDRQQRARAEFDRAYGREFFAYSRDEKGDTSVLRAFDPNAREIIMTVPLIGG